MSSYNWTSRSLLIAAVILGFTALPVWAQTAGGPNSVPQANPAAQQSASPAANPGYRVAESNQVMPEQRRVSPGLEPGDANEHPLMPAIRWARAGLPQIEKIQDYSATVAKRERVGDKLGDYEYMFVKIRHKPFSVYMNFLAPADMKGQEVIYVDGANNGKLWAHSTGMQQTMFGTVSLKPDGMVAMRNQRYPITELGIQVLTRRLIEVAEKDLKYDESEVKFFKGAKINDRTCTCIQVIHPVARKNFLFHIARIFVDDENNLPIRFESYDWPKEKDGTPELLEEYTYLNLKLNNGFTDADFDIRNPNYHFR